MLEQLFYIYKITNKVNSKIYIGKSVNPAKRFTNHISRAKTLKTNQPIHFAIAKIAELKSNQKQFGYNITDGEEGAFGRKQTESDKRKFTKLIAGKNIHYMERAILVWGTTNKFLK